MYLFTFNYIPQSELDKNKHLNKNKRELYLIWPKWPSEIVLPLIYLLTFNYRTYSDLDNNKHILTITNGSSYMAITFLPYQRINLNSGNQRNAKKGDILARDKTGLSHGLILAPRTASRST